MSDKLTELSIIKIKNLLAEKNFKDAYKNYEELAFRNPFDRKVINIKNLIIKTVEKENKEKIEKAILESKKLLMTNETEKALKILNSYIKVAPNHKKLNKLLTEAKKLYRLQIKQKQDEFDKVQGKKFSASMTKDVKGFLNDIIIFKRRFEDSILANNFLERAKAYYIHKKIETSQNLLNSGKYELIEQFISELKEISDSNPEVVSLEKKIKTEKYETQVQNLKESIYEAEKNIETLLKLKKFQKAYDAISELLKADEKNEKAKKFLPIARKGLFSVNRTKSIEIIRQNLPSLKNEYKLSPKKFRKI
ncbi:MAG: hypothetical protein RBS56_03795 [Candidatus Gracilibacteria bacterium]|jgi:hypothetical protein|nr:hypothetical protein [Candidatus Gracilibacteria bacterium]